ncbi:protoporphyrinogen oxidase HemJ [uncultured Litoreibacter sp.]|uniref:protoporphyrinogen oxidase HemJ n=1 Tax=uncultured Litoreibacter sp. TaxID=1392394 RepID=UPI00261CFF7E|nr:protoporphyrinogen oxidase HemJ [uncultured Litoreibacter sp.]
MSEFLFSLYPWVKALHIMAVISWMAGIFYLPRLFVHHTEKVKAGGDTDALFQMMEMKLLRVIMNPAMIVTWAAGLYMVALGIIDWSELWPWIKAICVLAMTWFHHWLGKRRKDFVAGNSQLTGRQFRMMNEVPTVLMVIIVISVVVRPF